MWMTRFHYHSFQSCWGFCFVFWFACFLSVTGLCVPSHKHQTAGQTAQCQLAWLPLLHRKSRSGQGSAEGMAWGLGVGGGTSAESGTVLFCLFHGINKRKQWGSMQAASPRLSVLAYQTSMIFICKHQALETSGAHKLVPSLFRKEEAQVPWKLSLYTPHSPSTPERHAVSGLSWFTVRATLSGPVSHLQSLLLVCDKCLTTLGLQGRGCESQGS